MARHEIIRIQGRVAHVERSSRGSVTVRVNDTALECLSTREPFYCHLGVVEESFNGEVTSTEPTKVCAGFTAAMRQKLPR